METRFVGQQIFHLRFISYGSFQFNRRASSRTAVMSLDEVPFGFGGCGRGGSAKVRKSTTESGVHGATACVATQYSPIFTTSVGTLVFSQSAVIASPDNTHRRRTSRLPTSKYRHAVFPENKLRTILKTKVVLSCIRFFVYSSVCVINKDEDVFICLVVVQ